VGRTGRAGRTGVGITFVGAEQATEVKHIAGQLNLHAEFERRHGGTPRRKHPRRRSD
jgi:ATP-dependent RNA helicase RhlE